LPIYNSSKSSSSAIPVSFDTICKLSLVFFLSDLTLSVSHRWCYYLCPAWHYLQVMKNGAFPVWFFYSVYKLSLVLSLPGLALLSASHHWCYFCLLGTTIYKSPVVLYFFTLVGQVSSFHGVCCSIGGIPYWLCEFDRIPATITRCCSRTLDEEFVVVYYRSSSKY